MEQRIHIVIHLPNDHPAEARAFQRIRKHLVSNVFPGEGHTLYKRIPGYWKSKETGELTRDYSTLFVIDVPCSTDMVPALDQVLLEVRHFVLAAYRMAGRPQEEIWITKHPIELCTEETI